MKAEPMLFKDRLLVASPELATFVEGFLTRVTRGGVRTLELPGVDGLPAGEWVRWLYRQWLAGGARWGPLVYLDTVRFPVDRAALLGSLEQAAGGWLFLEEGDARLDLPPRNDVLVLRQGRGVLPLPAGIVARIRSLDRFHLVTSDPALEAARRTVLAHCRAGSALHLSGPVGSGRRALVRWAHAALDERRLVELRVGDGRRPAPGDWLLLEGAGAAERAALGWLHDRVNPRPKAPTPELPTSRHARPASTAFAPIVGDSPPLVAVLEAAERVAPTPLAVLVLGESGTGKESMARAIHDLSGRRGPYVVADLAAMNENLVESELFGHVRGAFSGAERDRLGAFRSADQGTLFLDELGNIPLRVQAKLLRALQERVIQPVGDDRAYKVDVRIVAATNADLEDMVQRGDFREDLLRRVEAVTLRLPPLRARAGDVLALARAFLARERGRLPPRLSPEAERLLVAHTWPGNIRELGNVMAHAAAFAQAVVRPEHLGNLALLDDRPAPTLVVADESEPDRWLPDRLRAVRVRLPAMCARGDASVRAAILSLLDGRAIHADALGLLVERPWRGEYHELEAELAAVCANVPSPVTVAGLRRALPHLAAPAAPVGALAVGPEEGDVGEPTRARAEVADGRAAGGGRPPVPRLRAEEVAALNDVVLAYRTGSFAAHLEEALRGARGPLARAAGYVLGPRPTQYCVRLYEHVGNDVLRAELAQALALRPDAPALVTRLPEGLRAAVGSGRDPA